MESKKNIKPESKKIMILKIKNLNEKFGFRIGSNIMNEKIVMETIAGSSADGVLGIGWIFVKVNEIDVDEKTHDEIVDYMAGFLELNFILNEQIFF